MKTISDPVKLARDAANEYKACYGPELISAILFGSAAGGDFNPKKSDINLLVVLGKATLEAAEKSVKIQDQWMKKRFTRPLFMDKDYIEQSLDTFPIEFLNMRGCYQVLVGEDVFSSLDIQAGHLRLQVERELKGKRLHLMQQFLGVRKKPALVEQLLVVSMSDFSASFRALLHLKGQEIPKDRMAIFDDVGKAYGFQDQPFARTLEALRSGNRKTMMAIFPDYAAAIQKLSEIIDEEARKET